MKSIFKKTLCSIMLFCLLFLCVGVVTKVSAETATVTYTVASTTSVTATGTAPTGSTATFKNTYTTKDQVTKGKTATLTLSGFSGYKISTVVLSMHSNSSKGAGTFSMVVGATTLASINSNTNFNKWYDNTSFGTGYRDVTVALNEPDYLVQANENIVITIKASINSLYIEKYIITYANSSAAEQVKVTFDSNGGSDVSDQTIEKGTKATRPDVAPTYVGYEFLGWFEKDSDTAFDFDTEINESITLYAKWKATSYLPLLSLETKASLYVEWNTTVTTMPNVKYELVTNAEDLVAGDKLIIANIDNTTLATTTINNKGYLESIKVNFDGEDLPSTTNVEGIFTLGGKSGTWTLANSEGQLLGATAVKKLAWGKGTTTWSISFSGNDATIQNSTSSYGRILYNVKDPRFTTYTSSANDSMLLPQIYKVVSDSSSTIEVTNYEVTSLAMRFGMMIKKDLYDAIVADNIKFGVALVKGSKFDESKATFVECEPVRVNSDRVEDANGEYYQFAAVITDIPEADRTTNVIAKVYVYNSEDKTVLGYAQEKSMSVQTLAAAYGDYEGYEGILAYLKR